MTAAYIEVAADVRYWEDASINGQEDTDGKIPLRKNDSWCPVIELATGSVSNWPVGMSADIHYKVCDAGEYWLLDSDGQRIGKWAGYYVPNDFLCVGDNGYGDYIIFNIGADGLIKNWKQPEIEWLCECDKDGQHGWKKMEGDAA